MSSYNGYMAYIYDKLIEEDINYQRWSSKIIDICTKNNVEFDSYLDLGCGTGNLTEQLYKHFKSTWAVDMSEDMLSICQSKLGTSLNRIKFLCQDLRELNLNHKFDCITSSLDVLNYITDPDELKQSISKIYNHLKDGGIYIFDINSHYKLSEILGDNTFFYDDEDVFYFWDNEFIDDICNMNLTFFIKEGQVYHRFDELHMERAYKTNEIDSILNDAGFKIINKLENYTDKEIDDKTERITYIVKK